MMLFNNYHMESRDNRRGEGGKIGKYDFLEKLVETDAGS